MTIEIIARCTRKQKCVCVELEEEERSKRRTMELASGASSLPSFSLGREM